MSLDVAEMAERLARSLVPDFADGCAVEVATNAGALEQVASVGVDPATAPPSSVLGVALAVGERIVGALTVVRIAARTFTEEDRLLVDEVANRAALSLDNARLYRDAQQALRAREEMLAVVSHDLRNPLSVVGLSLRLLAPTVAADAGRAATLKRAQNAFERMHRLIEDLLDLARLDQGTMKIERARHSITGLLTEHVEVHRPLAEDRGIGLELSAAADAIVEVDRERIGQVLSNLVGNALKFTPRGGAVRVHSECIGRIARIAVEDTGRGIAPDALPRIFERGYQHGGAAARQGIGLGLVIAKGIVEAHGGTIDVASTVGTGTTVRFTLPIAAA
jgi:signal transduction histidine kinase